MQHKLILAMAGFVAVGLFIAFILKLRPIRRLPENVPNNTGQGSSDNEVRRLLAAGQKIEAIKLYRETYGTGLKEAKDAVDKIAEEGSSI